MGCYGSDTIENILEIWSHQQAFEKYHNLVFQKNVSEEEKNRRRKTKPSNKIICKKSTYSYFFYWGIRFSLHNVIRCDLCLSFFTRYTCIFFILVGYFSAVIWHSILQTVCVFSSCVLISCLGYGRHKVTFDNIASTSQTLKNI